MVIGLHKPNVTLAVMKYLMSRFMENILKILGATLVLFSSLAVAQNYPTFYAEEMQEYTQQIPEINYPEDIPTVCAPDDKKCLEQYVTPFSEHLAGNITAQTPPSPVYTFSDSICVLNNETDCKTLDEQWNMWKQRATYAGLDFAQGATQEDNKLMCQNVYNGWTLDYEYKCQLEKK